MTEKICKNCAHWDCLGDGEEIGNCQRFPPIAAGKDKCGDFWFGFPDAHSEDWCGEWKAREQ